MADVLKTETPICLSCRGRGWKLRRSRRAMTSGLMMRGGAVPKRVTCLDCGGSGHAR